MNLNINQTKLIGLTMELDLKAKEYKILCEKLDKLKENNIDKNDEVLIHLKREFQTNYQEIVEINTQIKELKSIQESEESQKGEIYNPNNIFKKRNNDITIQKNINGELSVIKEDNIFTRLLKKIKEVIRHKRNI